jgi:transcriptional regulator with XRE-family HTH domain
MNQHERLRLQIRAGRELLGMTQADLAAKMNTSLSKISRVESGETKSADVLLQVKDALERQGIRFTSSGVEIVEERLEIIEGKGCYSRLLDDVFQTLQAHSEKELLIMFSSDRVSPPEINTKYTLMRQAGITMRQIIEEGDTYLMGRLDEYRAIPSKYFINIVTVIYANKIAQVNGSETRIAIQTDDRLAAREKLLFQYYWDTGSKPTISTAIAKFSA